MSAAVRHDTLIPADIDARAATAVAGVIASITSAFLRNPDKLARLVWGSFAVLNVKDTCDLARCLVDVRRKIEGERNRGKAGHWTYEPFRLENLLGAEMALVELLARRAA